MLEKLRDLREKPLVSATLAIINILVFLATSTVAAHLVDAGDLTVWGVLGKGEYYRLVTAMFLHADIQHIANNMMLVFFMGAMVEKEFGHIPYLILYMVSGICGNLCSLAYKLANRIEVGSIGASGAAFGLDGAVLALTLFWPGYKKRVPLKRVGLMIILSLYSGFTAEGIDNTAHVGGLIAGFIVGSLICIINRIFKTRRIRHER